MAILPKFPAMYNTAAPARIGQLGRFAGVHGTAAHRANDVLCGAPLYLRSKL
jgi:hypothetical protein